MARRSFSGRAPTKLLASGIDNATATITIDNDAGWDDLTGGVNPSFFITVDRTESTRETMLCTERTGTTLTVTRGQDDTDPVAHASGATVEHTGTAEDLDDANSHVFTAGGDPHDQYMLADGTRHDLTLRHEAGTSIPTAVPTATVEAGDTAIEGTSPNLARADHQHPVSTGTPADIGTTAAEGAGTELARGSHVHRIGNGAIDGLGLFVSSLRPPLISETAPGTPITGQLWSRPSSLTVFMWNGSVWVAVADAYSSTLVDESSDSFTFTNTSYGSSGQSENCGLVFTAPATGQVLVAVQATLNRNTTGGTAVFAAVEVRTGGTLGSGTIVFSPTDSRALRNANNNTVRASVSHPFGLTAGDEYNVRIEHRVSTGEGAIADRAIVVQPVK